MNDRNQDRISDQISSVHITEILFNFGIFLPL